MEALDETAQELLYRETTYKILATFFAREPTQALLESLRKDRDVFEGTLKELAGLIPEGDLGAFTTDLNAEFARIFLNMSRNPVSLYESVYVTEEKVLLRAPHEKMKANFEREGIAITGMDVLPEDHISKEFLFMSTLIQRTREASASQDSEKFADYQKKQKMFFREHLEPWTIHVMRLIQERSNQPFYQLAGRFGEEFLTAEVQ